MGTWPIMTPQPVPRLPIPHPPTAAILRGDSPPPIIASRPPPWTQPPLPTPRRLRAARPTSTIGQEWHRQAHASGHQIMRSSPPSLQRLRTRRPRLDRQPLPRRACRCGQLATPRRTSAGIACTVHSQTSRHVHHSSAVRRSGFAKFARASS